MRSNGFGIRHLKGVQSQRGGLVYYWIPPRLARQSGIFRHVTLGTEYKKAFERTTELNAQYEAYRRSIYGEKPSLTVVAPNTAAWLARKFEGSPKFARYSPRARKDYARIYRNMEIFKFEDQRLFGDLHIEEVTRQLAYGLYEQCVKKHGLDSANKIMSAWQAAFKYGTLKIPGMSFNPFTQLGKEAPAPRRQRWTHEQLDLFVKKANQMRLPAIGRCALMCMELMQRPGDIFADSDEVAQA